MSIESSQIPLSSSGSTFLSEETITDDKINKKKCQRVSALKRVLFTFFLYSLAFTLVIPAFPSLLLRINNGRSDRASTMYGLASCIRYFLEFFSSSSTKTKTFLDIMTNAKDARLFLITFANYIKTHKKEKLELLPRRVIYEFFYRKYFQYKSL